MMKKLLLLFIFLGTFSLGFAQTPSKKMSELKEICLALRNNIGNEQIIFQTTNRYDRFMKENVFTSDYTPLNKKILSGEENIINDVTGKHIFFIPQYFRALLEKRDGLFDKYEELLEEWETFTQQSARAATGYMFRQENLIIRKGESVTFELTVPKGYFDIMAVAETNAFLSMRIQDQSTEQYYITEKETSAHKYFKFDSPTVLKVTIENVSQKDASIALFCF